MVGGVDVVAECAVAFQRRHEVEAVGFNRSILLHLMERGAGTSNGLPLIGGHMSGARLGSVPRLTAMCACAGGKALSRPHLKLPPLLPWEEVVLDSVAWGWGQLTTSSPTASSWL